MERVNEFLGGYQYGADERSIKSFGQVMVMTRIAPGLRLKTAVVLGPIGAQLLEANRSVRELVFWCSVGPHCELPRALGALASNVGLVRVDFCFLDSRHLDLLANVLTVNTTIRQLHLKLARFLGGHGDAFLDVLRLNTTLQVLDLKHIMFDLAGAETFAAKLTYTAGLRELNLSGCRGAVTKTVGAFDSTVFKLGYSLAVNVTLVKLDLGYAGLGDAQVDSFGEALCKNSTLQVLNLGCNNNISKASAAALARGIRHNKTLRVLDLTGADLNHVVEEEDEMDLDDNYGHDDDDYTFGVPGLDSDNDYARVYLDYGEGRGGDDDIVEDDEEEKAGAVVTDGWLLVLDALKVNTGLHEVTFGRGLGPPEGHALADVLRVNKVLRDVHLSAHSLETAGIRAIAEALESATALVSLDLGGANMEDCAGRAFAKALNSLSAESRLSKLNLEPGFGGTYGDTAPREQFSTAVRRAIEAAASKQGVDVMLSR